MHAKFALSVSVALLALCGRPAFCGRVEVPVRIFQSWTENAGPNELTPLIPAVLRFHLGSIDTADIAPVNDVTTPVATLTNLNLGILYDFLVYREETILTLIDGVQVRVAPGPAAGDAALLIGITDETFYFVLETETFSTTFQRGGETKLENVATWIPNPPGLLGWGSFARQLEQDPMAPQYAALFFVDKWKEFYPVPVRDLSPETNGRRPFALEHQVLAAAKEIYKGERNEVRVRSVSLNPLSLAYMTPTQHVGLAGVFARADGALPPVAPRNFKRLAGRHPNLRPHYLINRWRNNARRNPGVILDRAKLEAIGCTETFLEFVIRVSQSCK